MAASKGTRTSTVDRSYAGDTSTLNQARLDLAAWLESNNLAALIDDAQLVLSELTSNAVEASPGQPYRVIACIDQPMVTITVSNRSIAELPAQDEWTPDSVLALQGRGLLIVNALSESVAIEQTDAETFVSARLRIERD